MFQCSSRFSNIYIEIFYFVHFGHFVQPKNPSRTYNAINKALFTGTTGTKPANHSTRMLYTIPVIFLTFWNQFWNNPIIHSTRTLYAIPVNFPIGTHLLEHTFYWNILFTGTTPIHIRVPILDNGILNAKYS